MLQSRIQRPIPERLSHYTDLTALKSILSDQDGKGICFRADARGTGQWHQHQLKQDARGTGQWHQLKLRV